MFLRLIWRLVRQHIGLHYVWPLIIAIIIESLLARARDSEWLGFRDYWFNPSHLVGLLSVYVTFLWVIAISVKKASDVRSTRVQTLDDILPQAARYFGIGTIPLNDWFDPDSLVYLATIIEYQHKHTHVKHERVLLFYSDYDLQALETSYLDEHPARCLLAIHRRLNINLGFLGPEPIQGILEKLSEDSKQALGCYRRFAQMRPARWLPARLLMRKRPALLPFAFIKMKDDSEKFLKFKKSQTVLRLDEIIDLKEIEACKTLVSHIEECIYSESGKLKHKFNFQNFLSP